MLEALRQPLEDGRVAIARAHHCAVYPARFMLMAATNPCPCGYAGDEHRCRCSESDLARHRRRLSGPLLDRIDLMVHLHRKSVERDNAERAMTSRRARTLVAKARERQATRVRVDDLALNGHLDARAARLQVQLDSAAKAMLGSAREVGMLSSRGEQRTLRVARTIADLDDSSVVCASHLGAALALRPDFPAEEAAAARPAGRA